MTVLETPRLSLVPFNDSHLAGLAELNSDPEVMRYIGAGLPFTVAESQAMIDRVKARWIEHGYSWWAVLRKSDGMLIGAATLQPLEGVTGAAPEIGWRFRRDSWGQGYATEAARRVVAYAQQLRIPQLLAVAHPDNTASTAVMQRLGMRYRGIETHYKVPCATYEIEI
ncbi:Protein N-acetyltransferase, RimJ/RimL family [Duganella sacchari]|uniref:Protein N-acetyltransferase, RimJ/RimL family n=1 Tax=Duganella sacchari TaxID=551987 RepID=A0A1M7P3U1_9BURK|nr:GNAT family N-acetyltransferase [Duganella sacchari]SHN11214.1 Protein N-acetyltransferase, RimJ/RimL family [Duganella sacchari]